MNPGPRTVGALALLLLASAAGRAGASPRRATNASVVVVARGMLEGSLTPIG
jgi:hypothetical protein